MRSPVTTKSKKPRESYEQRMAAICRRRGHDMESWTARHEGGIDECQRCRLCGQGTVVTRPVVRFNLTAAGRAALKWIPE
jgi:hypothetical protein